MKESVESRLGLFFALAVILALIILESLGGFAFLQRGYHLHALFKNVQELRPRDPVKMAGVQVGTVENITLSNSFADVTMNLNRDAQVKTDSKASISFTGLMGQNFVELSFGTPPAPKAEDGATLQTEEKPDLSMLMTKLDAVATGVENLTRSFSGEKIDNLLGPFTDFLKNNQANLTASIANMKTISDNIAKGKGTVGRLINDDTLYVSAINSINRLQGTARDIEGITIQARGLMTNANDIMLNIRNGQGSLGKLLTDDQLYNEATGSLTNLHQILLKINNGQGSVGKLVNDDSLIQNAKLSLQKLDKATESLEDTGPLSIMGTFVTSLF